MNDNFTAQGYEADIDNEKLMDVFNIGKLVTFNVSIFSESPSQLKCRNDEKNVKCSLDESCSGKRISIEKNSIVMMDLVVDKIKNCHFKKYDDRTIDFQFFVDGDRYSIYTGF